MAAEYVGFAFYVAMILVMPVMSWWMIRNYGESISRYEWEQRFLRYEVFTVLFYLLCMGFGVFMGNYGEADRYVTDIPWLSFAMAAALFIVIPNFLKRQPGAPRYIFAAVSFLWLFFFAACHLAMSETTLWCGNSNIEQTMEQQRSHIRSILVSEILNDTRLYPLSLKAGLLADAKTNQLGRTDSYENQYRFRTRLPEWMMKHFKKTFELPDCHSSFTWHTLLTGLYSRHFTGTWKLWTPGGPIKEAIEKLEWRLDPHQPYPVE